MTMPVIDIKAVSFSYPQGQKVFEDVNLSIVKGDFLALIGPNGGGKTTLLKLMLGLLKPDKGMIRILDKTPDNAGPNLGYVPQFASHIQDFPITVWQLVAQGRLNCGAHNFWLTPTDKIQIQQALVATGTDDLAGRSLAQLSGGQKQRVLIARALAAEPQILLLDEPTAHLDTSSGLKIFDLLAKLNQQTTMVVVSHDLDVVSRYANKMVCVNHCLNWQPLEKMTNNPDARHG